MSQEVRTFGALKDLKNKLLGGVSHLVESESSQVARKENEQDAAAERVAAIVRGAPVVSQGETKEHGPSHRRRG